MVLIVYYDLMSQPCRAIVMFLRKTGIPFEPREIALRKGEHRKPEFLAINPLGKVPAIEDTDRNLKLTESVAILKYICDQFGADDHWYPKDLLKRSKVDEYCAWQHVEARYKSARVFINDVLAPGMFDGHGDIVAEMNKMLANLDKMFIKDNKFISGSEITIADLLASCELLQPTSSGRDTLKDYPRIRQWLERVRVEMNPHFDDVHTFVYKLRQTNLKKKGKL